MACANFKLVVEPFPQLTAEKTASVEHNESANQSLQDVQWIISLEPDRNQLKREAAEETVPVIFIEW